MFSNFGIGGKAKLRTFEITDLSSVLKIIEQTDEDDAEEAYQTLKDNTHQGMYVLVKGGETIGIIGADVEPFVEDVCWLSWTYLDEKHQGQGLGRFMFEEFRKLLAQHDVRRLFISTSDYMENGVDIYAQAKAFYQAMGARLELKISDYYDVGENKYIYSLDVMPRDPSESNNNLSQMKLDKETEEQSFIFTSIEAMGESQKGVSLNWELQPSSSTNNLSRLKQQAIDEGARLIMAAPPEDLVSLVEDDLKEAGFQNLGTLRGYYSQTIGQTQWVNYV